MTLNSYPLATRIYSSVELIEGGKVERTHPEKVKYAVLQFVIVTTLILTVGWTIMHYLLGANRVGFCLITYFVVNVGALVALRRGNFQRAEFWHILAFFCLPLLATWTEGGFEQSGLIALWSFVPVVELFIYRGLAVSRNLMIGYGVLIVLLIVADLIGIERSWFSLLDFGQPSEVTSSGRYWLYCINLIGANCVGLALIYLKEALSPD